MLGDWGMLERLLRLNCEKVSGTRGGRNESLLRLGPPRNQEPLLILELTISADMPYTVHPIDNLEKKECIIPKHNLKQKTKQS